MKHIRRKGQTWSFDLIIAVILFIVVVALFYTFLSGDRYQEPVIESLESDIQTINSRLDCDISSDEGVCIIQKGKISNEKIEKIAAADYDQLKVDLGISGDFCIYLKNEQGALVPMDGKIGIGKGTLLLANNSGNEIFCGEQI